MKYLALIALLTGGTLIGACSVSHTDGISLSENKWVDNNCTGNGYLTNPDWCANDFKASAGPYAN